MQTHGQEYFYYLTVAWTSESRTKLLLTREKLTCLLNGILTTTTIRKFKLFNKNARSTFRIFVKMFNIC